MVQRPDTTSGVLASLRRALRQPRHAAFAACLLATCIGAFILGAAQANGGGSFSIVRGGDSGAPAGSTEDVDVATGSEAAGRAVAGSSPKEDNAALADTGERKDILVVDVAGAVRVPGVYELSGEARVRDAIEAAGGLSEDADTSGINRASLVADGDKVYVPILGEASPPSVAQASPSAAPASLVNINKASEAELEGLPGVGPATATAIVEERAANGPYASVDDLLRVSGIGDKKLERLRDLVCT